jgi:hypothetical protein
MSHRGSAEGFISIFWVVQTMRPLAVERSQGLNVPSTASLMDVQVESVTRTLRGGDVP